VYEHLWLGVDARIAEAHHACGEMYRSLQQPPEHRHWNVALMAGAVFHSPWQDHFYGHVSTFLAKVRSVPSIIEACFGADRGSPEMRDWLKGVPPDELCRREAFSDKFRADRQTFRDHHLTNERDVSEHRRGFPNIEATVVGPFGTEYVARPDRRIPTSECRPLEPDIDGDSGKMWAATLPPRPIDPPRPDQWTVKGRPLFDECRAYLQLAQDIRVRAQVICDAEHAGRHLSAPPAS
jgi:hypothetical protein